MLHLTFLLVLLKTFIQIPAVKLQLQHNFCTKDMKVIRKHTNSNYIIGGLFPFHYYSDGVYKFNPNGLLWSQAMIHTIDEINKDQNLLPNVTLGYEIYDTCNTISIATEATLRLINIKPLTANNLTCSCDNTSSSIIAMIGDAASATTTRVASIMSAINTAQISYSATSTSLSEKQLYPSFLRTISPDNYQAQAIAKLLLHFQWDYINIIACDDNYGRVGTETLLSLLSSYKICVAVNELFDFKNDIESVSTSQIIGKLKQEQQASVVVLWCQRPEALQILRKADELKLYHRTWIATEAYASASALLELNPKVIKGMYGILASQKSYKPFEDYLQEKIPDTKTDNPWLNKYWELKGCKLSANKYHCSDNAINLSDLPRNKHINVIKGVYAIANGLDKYIKSNKKQTFFQLKKAHLLQYISKVNFTGKDNVTVSFDEYGNPGVSLYAIVNIKLNATTNKTYFQDVGTFQGSALLLKNKKFFQFAVSSKKPLSTCKEYCNPGHFQVTFNNQSCCWKCIQCRGNSVQPKYNQNKCSPCNGDLLANLNRTKCVNPAVQYLIFTQPANLCLVLLSMLTSIAICCSLVVIVKYRDTPIVKALNYNLSLIQLISMILLLGLPLVVFTLDQTLIICRIQLYYFVFLYVIAISITFTKADLLLRIFKKSKSGKLLKRCKNNNYEYFTVICLTSIGLVLCTVLLFVFKHSSEKTTLLVANDFVKINYHCGGKYDILLFTLLAYLVIIALICGVYAFKARDLPSTYNEAKYTSFSMFIFILTWVLFIPLYLSTESHFSKLLIWCYASLVTNGSAFSLMYVPKLIIILFQPDKNTRARFCLRLKKSNMVERCHVCDTTI